MYNRNVSDGGNGSGECRKRVVGLEVASRCDENGTDTITHQGDLRIPAIRMVGGSHTLKPRGPVK